MCGPSFGLGALFGILAGMGLSIYLDRHLCCPGDEFVDRYDPARPIVTCPASGWLPR